MQLLQAGVPRKRAAEACGIGEQTFYDHQRRSQSFRSAVEKAHAEAVAANVLIVRKAAREGTWQAAAWWLERRESEEFGRRDRIEATGKDGGPIKIDVSSYSTEQLQEVRRILRQPAGATRNGRSGSSGEEPA